jgi:hypothetical protein
VTNSTTSIPDARNVGGPSSQYTEAGQVMANAAAFVMIAVTRTKYVADGTLVNAIVELEVATVHVNARETARSRVVVPPKFQVTADCDWTGRDAWASKRSKSVLSFGPHNPAPAAARFSGFVRTRKLVVVSAI